MLNQSINVTWKPAEFFDLKKGDQRIGLINHKMELFDPIKVMVSDAFKANKQKMFTGTKLTCCDLRLTRKPREEAHAGYTTLTADVYFDLNEFGDLSTDPMISGPYVVDIVKQALPKLKKTGLIETNTIKHMVEKFEFDGFRYLWTMKESRLNKRDFRLKLEVSEYPALDCVWAEVTSAKLDIFERFEIFSQEKRFDLGAALVPSSRGEFTRHAGMYNVRNVSLGPGGLRFGKEEMHCYHATFGRGQLSDELCDALGIQQA